MTKNNNNDLLAFKQDLKERPLKNAKIINRDDTQASYNVEFGAIKPKMSTTKELILELKNEMNKRFDKVETRLDNLEKDVSDIKVRLTNVENDVSLIKSCPTIKKELKAL